MKELDELMSDENIEFYMKLMEQYNRNYIINTERSNEVIEAQDDDE